MRAVLVFRVKVLNWISQVNLITVFLIEHVGIKSPLIVERIPDAADSGRQFQLLVYGRTV